MFRYFALFIFLTVLTASAGAGTGSWRSRVTGGEINWTSTEPCKPLKDAARNHLTVVYLENLNFRKIGRNSNARNVRWLLSQGYRVIELNYRKHPKALSPEINADIVAINDSIASGSFCGYRNCSRYQSYVLFEGYRIERNVPYFKDDPGVYNTPAEYTEGDSLHMDIVYPANPAVAVPVILSFSYSNSYATYDPQKKQLTDVNKDQRLNLAYSLAGFNDSFLEGAPANGIAWAIADHPKYCPWGKGKPAGGANDTYKSFETNPDAVQKVKSAVRTLREEGERLKLSGKIGIFGFSRGSTAGSLAVGDRKVAEFENTGFHIGSSDEVQAAALGPGVFDYTQIYNFPADGDSNLETRCVWAWGPMKENYDKWQSMGAAYLVQSRATAPVFFFYNTDDEPYYQDQIAHFKRKLESVGVPTSVLSDYGRGHSVPQTAGSLKKMYAFFIQYLKAPGVENGKNRKAE